MKIILIFLILLFPKLLMGETKSLVCELEGNGRNGPLGTNYNETVKIQQLIKFNEEGLISLRNNFLTKEKFFEDSIVPTGVDQGVLEITKNIVTDENIKMELGFKSEILDRRFKVLNGEARAAYLSVEINRITGTSETQGNYILELNNKMYIGQYLVFGDCELATKKF